MCDSAFVIEDEKPHLWSIYVYIIKSGYYGTARAKMAENADFLTRLMNNKEYIKLPEENRMYFTRINQSLDCLEDVLSYEKEFQIKYYSKIKGFEDKDAAQKMMDIIQANPVLLQSDAVYNNVCNKLVDPGLKSKYTRMRKRISV